MPLPNTSAEASRDTCPVSAVIPAWQRVTELIKTIHHIQSCRPAPAEILVHVDEGTPQVLEALQREHPDVRVLTSPTRLGPGGGRNELVKAAMHELVASFDDDSFPEHTDYFARLLETAARFPDAAIISAASQPRERRMPDCRVIDVASGCGCVFRRSWFLRTRGFVPLPIAYGMEEVDTSLQLHALGGRVIHDPHLHVKHDKLPPTQVPVEVDATVLANIALLPVLRYPLVFAWVGVWQVISRCVEMIRQGRWQALGQGSRLMPAHWRKHR